MNIVDRERHRAATLEVLRHRRAIAEAELARAQRNLAFEEGTMAILLEEWETWDRLREVLEKGAKKDKRSG